MTACPIRYQRQVPDRKGKIFYTSITSLSHISKIIWIISNTVLISVLRNLIVLLGPLLFFLFSWYKSIDFRNVIRL